MRIGYNTNGFANHSIADAIEYLSRVGYQSVALTLQRDHFDPPDRSGVQPCVDLLLPLIRSSGLDVTLETGARHILDSSIKHQPTLISHDIDKRNLRIEFLKAAIEVAAKLNAQSVSLWSGSADDDAGEDEQFDRLVNSLGEVLVHAEKYDVRLSFEPEPGMLIDTMARYEKLYNSLDRSLFGLTLDVGHVHCLNDGDVCEHIKRWKDVLWNVHIEDMKRGVHEHLMFGEGDMDFAPIFSTLKEIQYPGPIHVELSRHSDMVEEVAKKSFGFLSQYI